jgi:hypothetical protein
MTCNLVVSLLLPFTHAQAKRVVDVQEYGARSDGSDATPGIRAALSALRQGEAAKLVFPPGRYDFWPDRAEERYIFASNNDEGLKRIAFPLFGMNGLEIDGGGSTFVFHGPIVPFVIGESQNVTLRNLSFDFARPFHSEGRVLALSSGTVDVEVPENFPFAVRHGVLVFTAGGGAAGPATTVKSGEVLYPYGSLLAYDRVKRETAYMAKDLYGIGEGIVAEPIGPRQLRLKLNNVSAQPGDVLVFSPKKRDYPGILISDSSQVLLSGVTIHHSGGMGVIAQRSQDLVLRQVNVTPPADGKRIVSTTADATHFVNCRGRIVMEDCRFEQQKDDATNVHGLYARITRLLAPHRLEVRLMHPQQFGIDFIQVGTRLEVTESASLRQLGYALVTAVERLNSECTLVETEQPLPAGVVLGDCVSDADANTAEVLIRNCVLRGNRARGLLLGSRGKIVIQGNRFHVPGASILFEGDARFWYEQAGVRDVVIRGNTFDNCNYGVWGNSVIQVGAGIAEEHRKTSRYNRNIVIEDNLFRVFSPLPLLSIYSVDGLTFRGNRLERTDAYPSTGTSGKLLEITDSDRVVAEEPLGIPPASA